MNRDACQFGTCGFCDTCVSDRSDTGSCKCHTFGLPLTHTQLCNIRHNRQEVPA